MCKYDAKFDEILIYLQSAGENEPKGYDLIDASIDEGETEEENFEEMLNLTMGVALAATAPSDTRNKDLFAELWKLLTKCIVKRIY